MSVQAHHSTEVMFGCMFESCRSQQATPRTRLAAVWKRKGAPVEFRRMGHDTVHQSIEYRDSRVQSRNDNGCGSGKKFKFCCYKKELKP